MIKSIVKLFNYAPVVCLLLSILVACEKPETVSFLEKEEVKNEIAAPEQESVKIAVGAIITPRTSYAYYRQLLNYIGERLGKPVEFIAQESYAEVNELLKHNKVQAAFVCGEPYVDWHEEYGLEILVAPQVNGKTTYHSFIIVHKESSGDNIDALRGKTFAFTDPESNSGKLVPTYLLAQMGETPDSFFKKYIYTYGHDKSIKAVAQKIVDGAAVDSLIYEYEKRFDPRYAEKTKVIFRSAPYGTPPIVVPRGIAPELKKKLKAIFLNVHKNPTGVQILKGMAIDRFVEIDDSAYDGIREMKDYLKRKDLL